MRLEISYQGGTTHEVELPGPLCVVGRDPACDIVLNDSKCSRRHAIVEETAQGVVIRDSGSANGIYVNGKKVESSPLRPGDIVRLGEVKLRLLPEIGETVIVAPEGLNYDVSAHGPTELGGDTAERSAAPPPAAPQPPAAAPPYAPPPAAPEPPPPVAAPPRPARSAPARPAARGRALEREPREARTGAGPARPATVNLLAALWALFVPLAVAGVLLGAARLSAGVVGWVVAAVLALALAGFGTAMALGLRALAPWARHPADRERGPRAARLPVHARRRDRAALHDEARGEGRLRGQRSGPHRQGLGRADVRPLARGDARPRPRAPGDRRARALSTLSPAPARH